MVLGRADERKLKFAVSKHMSARYGLVGAKTENRGLLKSTKLHLGCQTDVVKPIFAALILTSYG
jgi:hypothetical protein